MVASWALALFLLPVLCIADPIHMPLKRATRARTVNDYLAAADRARARYGYASSSSLSRRGHQRRASSQDITVTDQQADSSYFSSVSIGTPAQTFNVILDTGSADLWVFDSACSQCNDTGNKFDSSESSTFATSGQSPITITYGSGSVQGTIASDTVGLGSFSVSKQGLLVVEEMSSGLVDGDVSGILGLGFQSLAETQAVPFWLALINNNQLSSPEMSFHLARSTSQNDSPGGTFTLGGTNTALFSGSIDFQSVAGSGTPSFWLLEISAVTVQGSSVGISTGNAALAAVDTGTTAIGGPSTDVAAVWAKVPGASAFQGNGLDGFFGFPCSTSVEITISFGGQAWSISSEDINLGAIEAGSSTCVGALFDLTLSGTTSSGSPTWVVGDTFLKNVYSVFRQNPMSIGFAQLSTNAGGTGTSAGSTSSPSSPTSGASNNSQSPSHTGTSAAESSTSSGSSVVVLKKSANAGLIGGLVAAVVVIFAIAGVLLFLLRRRRGQRGDQASAAPPPPMSGVPAPIPALHGGAYAEPYAPGAFDASAESPTKEVAYDPYAAHGASMPNNIEKSLPTFLSDKPPTTVPSVFPSDKSPSMLPSGMSPSTSPSPSPASYAYAASTSAPASGSSPPSSSAAAGGGHRPLAVVGDSGVGGSGAYADLKHRQQEVVDLYERGLGGRDPPVREVDSGLRGAGLLTPQRTGGTEPPIYTPD